MRVYYFFYSVFYFIKLAFKKKHYCVIFYAPHYLNRTGKSENLFKKDSLNLLKIFNINFMLLEEPNIHFNYKCLNTRISFEVIYFHIGGDYNQSRFISRGLIDG